MELEDEITKWYIIGCQITQHPELDEYCKGKMKSFIDTLLLMLEDK